MKLHQLPSITKSKKKRLGRGYGSGKGGHTASRGQKGQKSRSSVPIWFEGGQLPFIRRLPFIKGKGRFKSLNQVLGINVGDLNQFKKDQEITPSTLIKAGLISAKEAHSHTIKILGGGELKTALKVMVPTTKIAAAKITKAGGSVDTSATSDQTA